MLVIHHLRYSRSTRVLWLADELELPYEMVAYDRDPATFRRPEALKAVHPLGKAPVIVDDGVIVAESGAIIEYLIERYAGGGLAPPVGHSDRAAYLEWLHFAEGSGMLGFLMGMFGPMVTDRAAAYGTECRDLALVGLEGQLGDRDFLVGDMLTGADINNYYLADIAESRGLLGDYPKVAAWHARLTARPALQRALAKGGPVSPPRR